MMHDLTTHVDSKLMEQWLSSQENRHIATGHVGTHLDTYEKSKIPLDYIKSKGVLLDVSEIAEIRQIELQDIKNLDIKNGSFLLIRTGRSEKIKYGTPEYFHNHPYLSDDLLAWLAKQPLHFIGIDCSGVCRGSEHEPADRMLEQQGIYVIENLSELDKLIDTSQFEVYTLWFEDSKATGLRCRVIAETK